MQITIDYDDYVSVLAYARILGRRLAPALEADLPALLGRRTPSGLRRVADAARVGRLHAGFPRDMLPIIADACSTAIEDGTEIAGEWIEAGYSDGGVDWAWRETTVYSDEVRCLIPLRAMLSGVIDLLDRIDDLVAAQREPAVQDPRRNRPRRAGAGPIRRGLTCRPSPPHRSLYAGIAIVPDPEVLWLSLSEPGSDPDGLAVRLRGAAQLEQKKAARDGSAQLKHRPTNVLQFALVRSALVPLCSVKVLLRFC